MCIRAHDEEEMVASLIHEEDDSCAVCNGSGFLLKDSCPLCGDDSAQDASVATMPLMPKSPLCLVLDIDGTMLAESENVGVTTMASLLRPHLQEFLDFAFASFSAVAIWTAASQEWMDAFLQAVDPDGKRHWAFAWSYSRISWLRLEGGASENSSPVFQHVKRLSKIWKNKALRARGFLPHTTLIVDNNPGVCLASYGNAIYIKTYSDIEDAIDDQDDRGDDWLLVLMEYLKHLHETQVPGQTVRHVDKRGWYSEMKSAGLRQRAHTWAP